MLRRLSILKGYLEKLSNTRIYINFLPPGVDKFYDLNKAFPNLKLDLIFDVGANIGQSANEYIRKCPNTQVYSFEPVTSTFNLLQQNLFNRKNIKCFNLALGSENKKEYIIKGGKSDTFSINRIVNDSNEKEEIIIRRLDDFCKEYGIKEIDFLKIDTEGYDLEVLKGACKMLENNSIKIIQVEAGMNPYNSLHISFEILKRFLESNDYYLFKIYDQVKEWDCNSPFLRRSNPIFISNKLKYLN